MCSRRPSNCKTGHFTSWNEEEGFEMYKSEKRTCKACKTTVFHCSICKFVTFLMMEHDIIGVAAVKNVGLRL